MKRRNIQKHLLSLLLLITILLNHGRVLGNTAYTGIRENITPLEYTCEMGAGLNLFNTLDATCEYQSGLATEICWGQPYTTKNMINAMSEKGFKTLRIPVTWYKHMSAGPNYTIDKAWLDRVEEVANYAFENDMYVIINMHHEDVHADRPGSWLFPSYATKDDNIAQIEKIWTQIATRFKDYGDHLIFETLNEPRPTETSDEWNGGNAEHREVINAYNLAAVNAIRATGGNNASRFIMVPQIAAQLYAAINHLVIPNNDPRVLVSVHHYSPYSFALDDNGAINWGTTAEIQALDNDIKKLYDTFISKGIGVVMGEWGAHDKGNLAQRVNYYDIYAEIMKKYQITPVVWMFNFNRTAGTWETPELEDAIIKHFQNSCTAGLPQLDPIQIPGKFEAEDFTTQSGIQSETTSDIGGGKNIGFIENNDFTTYQVQVESEESYDFNFRVASQNAGGSIEIYLDGTLISTVAVSSTSGWQTWQTVSTTANLTAGNHELKFVYKGAASFLFNLNWVEVQQSRVTSVETIHDEVSLYPNPTTGFIQLSVETDWEVYSAMGIKLKNGSGATIDLSGQQNGIYMVKTRKQTFKISKL